MKWIKYKICNRVNLGTEAEPKWNETFVELKCKYSETGLAIVKKEAYNGEYAIEDDEQPEPEAEPTDKERIADLEEAMDMILSGVTE